MTLISVNVFGFQSYNFVYGSGITSITCQIGDTLKFYDSTSTASQRVYLFNPIQTQIFYNTPSLDGYLCSRVIDGTEQSCLIFINSNLNSGCSITITATGINELSKSNIKIFPNPVVDFLKITSPFDTKVSVFNMTGQLVLTKDIEAGTSEIYFGEFLSGVYFIEVNGKSTKIVKN